MIISAPQSLRNANAAGPLRAALLLAILIATPAAWAAAPAPEPASLPSGPSAAAAPSDRAPTDALARWQAMKLGLFIHFGPWSQTGHGSIWDIALDPDPTRKQSWFDLFKTFNPRSLDASQWAKLARTAGCKYVMFTTKHHDGFCLFDTHLTPFRITAPECPYSAAPNPDITRQIADSFRAQGLAVGLYYSNLDWHALPAGFTDSGKLDPRFPITHPTEWKQFVTFMNGQVQELLTGYGRIDEFWFDIPWPDPIADYFLPMMQTMRRLQPRVIINDRAPDQFADFTTFEQEIPTHPVAGPWETCMTISEGTGFWYKGSDAKYKSARQLVRLLAETCAKGGNLLLNIGPRGDGTLAPEEIDRLAALGAWLSDNGQAIYHTTRGPDWPEPWGAITRQGQRLYLIDVDPPAAGQSLVVAASMVPSRATLLSNGQALTVRPHPGGFEIDLPAAPPASLATVITADFTGDLDAAVTTAPTSAIPAAPSAR